MSDSDDDAALVRAARTGSVSAFNQLVRRHQQPLRAFLRRVCDNPADADDLAQASFVLAWCRLARFDEDRVFRSWLFGIAWRKCREQRRGWLRRLAREGYAAMTSETSPVIDPGARLDLAAAAARLPATQRAAVLLCFGSGFSHTEAAEALGLPLGTLKSHLARARRDLIEMLGDDHAQS
ncbi:MAG: sigma-70 family RNA polymerase sigma factor [Caulobacter sp.]|nr:sigma-70 family RNA polymerase sigma factor [Caulobacter sp.]